MLLVGSRRPVFVKTFLDKFFTLDERAGDAIYGYVELKIRHIPTGQRYAITAYVELVDRSTSHLVLGPQDGMRIFLECFTSQPQDLSNSAKEEFQVKVDFLSPCAPTCSARSLRS